MPLVYDNRDIREVWYGGRRIRRVYAGSRLVYDRDAAPVPVIPDIPDIQTILHDNGTEPATGTKWYVTPTGNGAGDGTSWADAAPGSSIHVILLSCASGDSVYFAEGTYTSSRVIGLPAGVSLYGGFDAEDPAWATRNGFDHPTVFTGNGTFGWLAGDRARSGQMIDGISVTSYAKGIIDGNNLTLRNGVFTSAPVSIGTAEHCVFAGSALTAYQVTYCNVIDASCQPCYTAAYLHVYGRRSAPVTAECGAVTDSRFVYAALKADTVARTGVYYADCTVTGATASYLNVQGTSRTAVTASMTNASASNCRFAYARLTALNAEYTDVLCGSCTLTGTAAHMTVCGTRSSPVSVLLSNADSCSVIYGTAAGLMITGHSVNCTAINCSCTGVSPGGYFGRTEIAFFYNYAENCTAIYCSARSAGRSGIFGSPAQKCSAINCLVSGTSYAAIFASESTSSAAVNCSAVCSNASSMIFSLAGWYNTAVNCAAAIIFNGGIDTQSRNNLSWNNQGAEFAADLSCQHCAGTAYSAKLSVTLGPDNSIARFTNTGYFPACGVQPICDCPSPIDDPTGYADYLAAFGDWHPLANSFLVGAGMTLLGVTTDADGVTRPDPPAIGAYEPVPAQTE